jgi:hypothetical protein
MRCKRGDRTSRLVSKCGTAATRLSIALVTALVAGACGGNDDGPGAATGRCGFDGGARCQPESRRVDRSKPSFSHPTRITNPLFPVTGLTQVLQLGEEEGKPSRVEVTRLPTTKTIEWNGRRVETVVQQFVAYLDRRIIEVALDYFAQADDGSVWYFGEAVSNYKDGVIADNEGTWLAGKDGPPGMIMPAHPEAGDVYRPENVPGLVFEEDTVKSVGETVDGPHGRVERAIVVREHLMDNTFEEKVFAPGYGEFQTRTTDEEVATAIALPVDARSGRPPTELEMLSSAAGEILEDARSGDWPAASTAVAAASTAWTGVRAGAVPALLAAQMSDALDDLVGAVDRREPAGASRAAIDVTRAGLDLQLRHRPHAEVDVARLDLWSRQLAVDAASDTASAVAGDVATLEAIRDRIAQTLGSSTGPINAVLHELRAAADSNDLSAASEAGARLRTTLAALN